jgi:hypothetical protein
MRALVQLLEAERSRGGPACPASLADVKARVLVVAGSEVERAWKESIPVRRSTSRSSIDWLTTALAGTASGTVERRVPSRDARGRADARMRR